MREPWWVYVIGLLFTAFVFSLMLPPAPPRTECPEYGIRGGPC